MSLEETLARVVEETVRRVVREELQAGAGSDVLSTEQAAAVAGVSSKTVRAWINEGRLQAGRRGRLRTVRREDLDRFLAGEAPAASKGEALLRRVG
jgi:excisionase family DNA binding protein